MKRESGETIELPEHTTLQGLATVAGGEWAFGADENGALQSSTWPNFSGCRVVSDSRAVEAGDIFLAYRGIHVDGHQYIQDAKRAGAIAIIQEREERCDLPTLVVTNSRWAQSAIAAYANGYPTKSLKCFGITGTNGKTTSLWLLSSLLTALGERVLKIGTLGIEFEGEVFTKGETTTPTAPVIQKAAAWAKAKGSTACVMEVSSHSLHQSRADHVFFDGVSFTNLTPDHLDYHPSLEEYFLAKRRLFELARDGEKKCGMVSGNFDPYGKRLIDWCQSEGLRISSFGYEEGSTFQLKGLTLSIDGASGRIKTPLGEFDFCSSLIGRYNADNLLGVISLLHTAGYPVDTLLPLLPGLRAPRGRMERFTFRGGSIFVDYAHAPDALRNALQALRPVTKGALVVLFGCGGNKDPRRRVGMGQAAGELADKVIVTSDNPRNEDPEAIIQDILSSGLTPALVEVDRRKAIARAMEQLQPGDVLLIAGKGHEEYQIIGGKTEYFSDQEEVQRILQGGSEAPGRADSAGSL